MRTISDVDIGHDLVDQRTHDALLQPCIGCRRRPDRLEIRGYQAKRRRIDDRRRRGGVMRGDLALHLGDAGKRAVPARFQLAGYEPIGGSAASYCRKARSTA